MTIRPLLLSLLVLPTIPLLALLCRGHTPSRLATANLPIWEQHPPRALPACRWFRLSPLPPGAVLLHSSPILAGLLQTDENRLLLGVEHPGQADAGSAGRWLEAACVWGRSRFDLSAKQDRIATRLMAAQDADGLFGVRHSHPVPDDGPEPALPALSPRDAHAQAACLRGLLAYYALTRRPAVIYAAMMAGNRALARPAPLGERDMPLPLTRLYQQTGETRYLAFARQREGGGRQNGLDECALYEATGQVAYLQAAQQQWARGQASPALTTELLLLTGRPGYAAALNRLPAADPALAQAAWTFAPHGIAVNTAADSEAALGNLHFRQRTTGANRTISIQTPHPQSFALRLFLPPGSPAQLRINGVLQPTTLPGRYALLTRRWRNGDVVEISSRAAPPAKRTQEGRGNPAPTREPVGIGFPNPFPPPMASYVPSCQEARYRSCSSVSVSIWTPSDSSFRRAIS